MITYGQTGMISSRYRHTLLGQLSITLVAEDHDVHVQTVEEVFNVLLQIRPAGFHPIDLVPICLSIPLVLYQSDSVHLVGKLPYRIWGHQFGKGVKRLSAAMDKVLNVPYELTRLQWVSLLSSPDPTQILMRTAPRHCSTLDGLLSY